MFNLIKLLTEKLNILKLLISLYQKLIKTKEREIHIVDLAKAMAEFEGWYIENSRAWRNCNPLNLRWSPQCRAYDTDSFCKFIAPEKGWKAALWDLDKKCRGYTRTGLKPTSTIKDLIFVWTEDNKQEYLNYVVKKLKISSEFRLKDFILAQPILTLEKYLKAKKI